jgi:hypothetical protein
MNRTPRVMAFAAVCLTLGVPAIGGTLNSPMMFADNNGQARVLFCSAVNVGTGPIAHVAVSIVDNLGNALASNTCTSLAANEFCGAGTSPSTFLLRGHCAITGSGQFRAAFQVNDANFNTIAVVPFGK